MITFTLDNGPHMTTYDKLSKYLEDNTQHVTKGRTYYLITEGGTEIAFQKGTLGEGEKLGDVARRRLEAARRANSKAPSAINEADVLATAKAKGAELRLRQALFNHYLDIREGVQKCVTLPDGRSIVLRGLSTNRPAHIDVAVNETIERLKLMGYRIPDPLAEGELEQVKGTFLKDADFLGRGSSKQAGGRGKSKKSKRTKSKSKPKVTISKDTIGVPEVGSRVDAVLMVLARIAPGAEVKSTMNGIPFVVKREERSELQLKEYVRGVVSRMYTDRGSEPPKHFKKIFGFVWKDIQEWEVSSPDEAVSSTPDEAVGSTSEERRQNAFDLLASMSADLSGESVKESGPKNELEINLQQARERYEIALAVEERAEADYKKTPARGSTFRLQSPIFTAYSKWLSAFSKTTIAALEVQYYEYCLALKEGELPMSLEAYKADGLRRFHGL